MSDGMNYAPRAAKTNVVERGSFRVAAIGLDHGHIYGMCQGLSDAGAQIAIVYDRDPDKVAAFVQSFPDARAVRSRQEALDDSSIDLVASAAIPSERGPIGLEAQAARKHYMSDKAPFTGRDQLAAARVSVASTGLKWGVCYSERVQNEAGVFAGQLIADGAIGSVLQVIGLGPHRLGAQHRPRWFFERQHYGGILIDIGSHQIEQFLYYSGARSAKVVHSKVGNLAHPQYPELEDFGDASLVADNGATNYFRVDWFTPDGLSTWGDGRTFILGTDGYLELRKYVDIAHRQQENTVLLVDGSGERRFDVTGKVGFPYFGQFILDCIHRTDIAMPQDHTFRAAELCIDAQEAAQVIARSQA